MYTLSYKALFKYGDNQLNAIRKLITFFIIFLFLSGLTAIPVDPELSVLLKIFPSDTLIFHWFLLKLAGKIYGRALFRSALSTGVLLAAATGIVCSGLLKPVFSTNKY